MKMIEFREYPVYLHYISKIMRACFTFYNDFFYLICFFIGIGFLFVLYVWKTKWEENKNKIDHKGRQPKKSNSIQNHPKNHLIKDIEHHLEYFRKAIDGVAGKIRTDQDNYIHKMNKLRKLTHDYYNLLNEYHNLKNEKIYLEEKDVETRRRRVKSKKRRQD